jgi:hypothetical protein
MYISLVFIVMLVSGTFIIMSISARDDDNARQELQQYATYIEEQVVDQYDNPKDFAEGMASLFITNTSQKGLRGHILDKDGNTVASSVSSEDGYQSFTGSAVISALAGRDAFVSGKREADKNGTIKEWISLAHSVLDEGGNVEYVIYVQMDGESIRQSHNQVTRTILIASVIAIMLAAAICKHHYGPNYRAYQKGKSACKG